MTDSIGERVAALTASFNGFKDEMVSNNKYVREKLDTITASLPNKVDRPYCQDRHEKLDGLIREVEKDGKYEKLADKVDILEGKTPAIIQQIVLVFATGTVMAIVSYVIGKL